MNKEKIIYFLPLVNLIIFILIANLNQYSMNIFDFKIILSIYSILLLFVIILITIFIKDKEFKIRKYLIFWGLGALIGFVYGVFIYPCKGNSLCGIDSFLFFSVGIVYYHIPALIVLGIGMVRRKNN